MPRLQTDELEIAANMDAQHPAHGLLDGDVELPGRDRSTSSAGEGCVIGARS
jgi:hypothetical protein